MAACGKTISIEIQHIVIGAIITAALSIVGFVLMELYGLNASNAAIAAGFDQINNTLTVQEAFEKDLEKRVAVIETDVMLLKLVQREELRNVTDNQPQ